MAAIDDMLRKVQALLRKADHENTSATEARTFRNKAEALMMRYRIDEAMLVEKGADSVSPRWGWFTVSAQRSPYRYYYQDMAQQLLYHFDVRGVVNSTHRAGVVPYDVAELRCDFVGFESDIRLVELLYTECMLAFQTRLEPGVDRSLTDEENVDRLRRAGMEWYRITNALWGETDHRFVVRARRLFLKRAAATGEDVGDFLGMGNNMKVFRESYANGFVSEVKYRLYHMRMSRGAESQGLMLAGRKEAIDAAFYERYPQYAPPKPLPVPEGEEEDQTGEEAGVARSHTRDVYVDPRAACKKCQRAKTGYCRDHAYMRPSSARYREAAWNPAADAAGRRAARSVDLGSTSPGRTLR